MDYGNLLWKPTATRRLQSSLAQFAMKIGVLTESDILKDQDSTAYRRLHQWSIENIETFWSQAADYLGLSWLEKPTGSTYKTKGNLPAMCSAVWFEGGRLNYAENIFKGITQSTHRSSIVVGHAEGSEKRIFDEQKIRQQTLYCQEALKYVGSYKGSPVCGVLSHVPEALIAMLGVTSLGGVWSSCSPDFGADAIFDRFIALSPKVLFLTKRYRYMGKEYSMDKMAGDLIPRLKSLEHIVWIDHLGDTRHQLAITQEHGTVRSWTWDEWLAKGCQLAVSENLYFEPMKPNDPLFILFSSGTTGLPKCIVHGVLGTLLQHKKEHVFHCDLGPQDRLLYYTTCGWMMWNWKVSALASGAALEIYDGAVVSSKDPNVQEFNQAASDQSSLWDLVEAQQVSVFGTSPKFLSHCMAKKILQNKENKKITFKKLRTVLTTGAPLLPDHGEWIYNAVAPDVHLASISGGTDIVSCFMLGNPFDPVRAGEIQGPGLGMAVEAWDESGSPVIGSKGELVCTKPFPSMPLGFWNDPDGSKYRNAYFDFFPGREVWRHGDFIEITPMGGIIVYGRSDATLNPGGIRIGSAEIYRQVESISEVLDSIVVGVKESDDTPMALFVKVSPGMIWSEELKNKIKQRIRTHLTPRHIPKWIFSVGDIPYTRSGKKMEIAVTQILAGEQPTNTSSCGNPDSFKDFMFLKEQLKATL